MMQLERGTGRRRVCGLIRDGIMEEKNWRDESREAVLTVNKRGGELLDTIMCTVIRHAGYNEL